MKVLVNHYTQASNQYSGLTAYMVSLVEALRQCPEIVIYLLTASQHKSVEMLRADNVKIVRKTLIKNESAACFVDSVFVTFLLKKLKIDVVLNPQPPCLVLRGVSIVQVIHDLYRKEHSASHSILNRLQWNFWAKVSLDRASRIIAVSEATQRSISLHYPQLMSKVYVVHEAARPLFSNDYIPDILFEYPYILTVCRVAFNKRISAIITAFQRARLRVPELKFILVGTDPDQLIGNDRFDVDGIVHIQYCSDHDLGQIYRGALCYVNASSVEGFCLPVLEAQAAGIPVVCSDIPVLREVAGDGALFFHVDDDHALSNYIEQIWENQELRLKLISRGLANSARFSWRETADKIHNHLVAVATSQSTRY